MKIASHRFGDIDVPDELLLHFPEGLVGLARHQRFALLQDPESEHLLWMQSTQEKDFALATVHYSRLGFEYQVEVQPEDLAAIGAESPEEVLVFVVLNRQEGKFYVNLRGPILIHAHKRLGKQVVLANPTYQVRHPLESPAVACPVAPPVLASATA